MISNAVGWLFGTVVLAVGIANLVLVHPVPGFAYVLVSLLYYPPANTALRRRFGFSTPATVKVLLGAVLVMFTLGVSDLGDMIDLRDLGPNLAGGWHRQPPAVSSGAEITAEPT